MIGLVYVGAAMAAAYIWSKNRAQQVGAVAGPAYNAGATSPIPETQAGRIEAPTQQYFPQGFSGNVAGPSHASPTGANTNPASVGLPGRGASLYEASVYTEVSTPYTPVGAFTRATLARAQVSQPKITTIAGGSGHAAHQQTKPMVRQTAQGGVRHEAKLRRRR